MKLKYYLRGLGIGIVVTAIVMSVMNNNGKSMSDEEIKSRAAELGMVEENTLLVETKKASQNAADVAEAKYLAKEVLEKKKEPVISVSEDTSSTSSSTKPAIPEKDDTVSLPSIGTKADEKEDGQAKKSSTSSSVKPSGTKSSSTKSSSSSAKPAEAVETVNITISSGQSSMSIAQACEAAGLVESAFEFDRFLSANGYDRKLATGNHVIPQNATADEIGKLLTQKQ